MAYKWVHSSIHASIPPNAVVGGNDSDGSMMYVGRSYHNGDMLVAKVIPSKQTAFVSWHGQEVPKEHFEVLCGLNLAWQHCYDHLIPENAILCGKTALEQSVYVGRGHFEGSLTVGKVSSVHRALFIPFNGMERRLESYEILVEEHKPEAGWAIATAPTSPTSPLPPPPPSFFNEEPYPSLMDVKPPIGFSTTESATALKTRTPTYSSAPYPPLMDEKPPSYSLMSQPTPFVPPGSAYPSIMDTKPPSYSLMPQPTPFVPPGPAYPSIMDTKPPSYSLMPQPTPFLPPGSAYPSIMDTKPSTSFVPPSYHPQTNTNTITPATNYEPSTYTTTPMSTITPATNYEPPPSYCCTPMPPTSQTSDLWVPASSGYTPPNAVAAGHDTDQTIIFVCRAFHAGDLIPGKALPNRTCAYIPFAGQEIPKYDYEILVGHQYHWVPAFDGNVAPGAVEAGRTAGGEPLFVGRAHYCGSLTPGKIQRSQQCLYIAFGGQERRVTSYEVLVRRNDYYRSQALMMNNY